MSQTAEQTAGLPQRQTPAKQEVERCRELFDLGSHDQSLLRRMEPWREAAVLVAAKRLESHFLTLEATRSIFEIPHLAAQARAAHLRYFGDFGRLDDDRERMAGRLDAISALTRLGFHGDHWLSAYHTFLATLMEGVSAEIEQPAERQAMLVTLIKAAFVDIAQATERQRSDDKLLLADATRLLNDLLDDGSGEAVVLQNLDGTILTWSQGAVDLYGYEAHEIVGQPADLLFASDREELERVSRLFAEARENGRATMAVAQRTKLGKPVRVELMVSLRRSGSGAPLGWLLRALSPTSRRLARQGVGTPRPGSGQPTPRGLPTILVAEDNRAVRQLVQEILERIGYRVITASNGREALELSRTTDEIALLVTDVAMPGMSGRETAEAIRRERPDLKIMFLTGYAADFSAPGNELAAEADVLTKPFTVEQLRARVHQALER